MFDEKEILAFWEKNKVFEKSVANRKPSYAKATEGKKSKNKLFTFFEGPPTANGKPHIGHFETRVFKDIVLRYKTMRGFFTLRRAGWDTHGLPVEVEVEKNLGLKSKKEIEAYGVAAFNKKCRESVWQYKGLWEEFTKRMGFWIDMAHPYITYENSYIESLWAVIKEFANKKLLYEDYKVMPWCARCGTALSSHELAQGYEKVSENSVFVKFKLKPPRETHPLLIKEGKGEVFFLIWTTTPWTLPGNVALAVNPKVDYVFATRLDSRQARQENNDEILILAEARVSILGDGYSIIKKIKGAELAGQQYESLYLAVEPPSEATESPTAQSFSVVAGDFVSTEDGTGIVHIAPAFGDDDFQLSKKFDLPVLTTTGQDGLMKTIGQKWDGEWFKKSDPMIIEDLKSRGLLFKEEKYEHDYPFCWRCKNPLMYLARNSWWVDVNAVRKELIANNQKINWHPEHIKDGRFGEWLKEKKNWAFSRERYWGTPLPVWRCDPAVAGCGNWEAIGSIDELKKRSLTSGNKYFIMRHGEAENNVKKIINCNLEKNHYSLTANGRKQVGATIKIMQKKKINPDMIFASPFLRTKETAELVAKALGVGVQNVKLDPRLGEVQTGIFAGGHPKKYHDYFTSRVEKLTKTPPGGENLTDLKKRMFAAISEIELRYQNKTILIVSHEYPLWMLWTAVDGKTDMKSAEIKEKPGNNDFIKTAELMNLNFFQIPRDENLVLDMHKPFIDEIQLKCKCGGTMRRVPEVCDVWFDSGSMPFASNPSGFPADYIVEAIDQTRGWFYTLLAVSTLLGKGAPYKNVISLGHVLDAKGKKMSKSLGNIVEPMALIEKYGADAARWYFFTINQPWDTKAFNETDVKDASRRFFMILWNVLQFYKMYAVKRPSAKPTQVATGSLKPSLLINKWVLAKLNEVTNSVTKKLDAYDIVGAARELENFITEDISRWYVRRIRDVMKDDPKARLDSRQARQETSAVLGYLLAEVSKLLAPFAPFISEKIWWELGNKGSVHLEDWVETIDKLKVKSDQLLKSMEMARSIVALALEARQKAGIKVRQSLALLKLNKKYSSLDTDYLLLIKEEVNIKKIETDNKLKDELWIDTNITSELKEEGALRDLIREIQSARKTAGLKPKDKVVATLELPKEIYEVAEKNEKILVRETNLKSIKISEAVATKILLK